jgi:hypothetical protein
MFLIPNTNGLTSVTTTILDTTISEVALSPSFNARAGMLTRQVNPGLWQLNLYLSLSSLPTNPIYFYQILTIYDGSTVIGTVNGSANPTRISASSQQLYTNSIYVNYIIPTNYNVISQIYFISPTANSNDVSITTYYNDPSTYSSINTIGLANIMDLNTTQLITGDKTFTGSMTITGKITMASSSITETIVGNANVFTITQFFT